jgi:predicted RNase H-like HicB family nuclease
MQTLTAIIESLENNYSAYIKDVDGVVATGSTIEEIKANLVEAVRLYVETCHDLGCDLPEALKGEYQIVFSMDVKSLLTLYQGIFTKAGLEKLTGINQKQLWHYASGISTPRKAQVLKIEKAIHRLGQELLSIQL